MNNAKHTQGPWSACDHGDYSDNDGNSIIILSDAVQIRLAAVFGKNNDETKATANLMAAAPELLEALLGMLAIDQENHQRGHDDDDVCKEVQTARAAIAKATGVAPSVAQPAKGGEA